MKMTKIQSRRKWTWNFFCGIVFLGVFLDFLWREWRSTSWDVIRNKNAVLILLSELISLTTVKNVSKFHVLFVSFKTEILLALTWAIHVMELQFFQYFGNFNCRTSKISIKIWINAVLNFMKISLWTSPAIRSSCIHFPIIHNDNIAFPSSQYCNSCPCICFPLLQITINKEGVSLRQDLFRSHFYGCVCVAKNPLLSRHLHKTWNDNLLNACMYACKRVVMLLLLQNTFHVCISHRFLLQKIVETS